MRLLLIIFLSILVASCNKELPDDFVPYNASLQADTTWKTTINISAPVNDLHDIFTDDVSIQGFYADTGGTFVINDSLKIEVPANALLKNGSPIVGLVTVNIQQYRTKGQLIAANLSTLDNSQVLQTAGAFNVEFYHNSDRLTLASGKKYTLTAKHLTGELLQNLTMSHKVPGTTDVQTIWTPSNDGSTAITSSTSSAYTLMIAGLGWYSAVKPLNITGAEPIRLNVILPVTFTNANTLAFAVFKDHNAVVRLKPDAASKSFYAENIPAGKAVKVITISKVNGLYYFGATDTTATKGSVIKITPEKKSSSKDIVSIVLSL